MGAPIFLVFLYAAQENGGRSGGRGFASLMVLTKNAFADGLLLPLCPDRDAAGDHLEVSEPGSFSVARLLHAGGMPTGDESLRQEKIEEGWKSVMSPPTPSASRACCFGRWSRKETRSLDQVAEPRTMPAESDPEIERRVGVRRCLAQLPRNRDLILHITTRAAREKRSATGKPGRAVLDSGQRAANTRLAASREPPAVRGGVARI